MKPLTVEVAEIPPGATLRSALIEPLIVLVAETTPAMAFLPPIWNAPAIADVAEIVTGAILRVTLTAPEIPDVAAI